MLGSQFVQEFSGKGLPSWEAAAIALARQDGLTPWPFAELVLTNGSDEARLHVQTDVLSIGSIEDHVRLPLTPTAAQSVCNLFGWLLPTPWLVYQIWRSSEIKLEPMAEVPNKGADLRQYLEHSQVIDAQIANLGAPPAGSKIAGHKKGVVVSNIMKPGKVVIFGWYRPPPAPDVFDDRRTMLVPDRQPIQPLSNVHGDFYVDYSHGLRAIAPTALVNGQSMATVDLYQHPTLSRLVSNEGPLRTPRYPSPVPPAVDRPGGVVSYPTRPIPTVPGLAEWGVQHGVGRKG